MKVLISIFGNIPYDNYIKNTNAESEGYYAWILEAHLSASRLIIKREYHTNKGRIDLLVKTNNSIYIIELKVLKDGDKEWMSLEQIKYKKYYEWFISEWKDIYLMWLEFKQLDKNIHKMYIRKLWGKNVTVYSKKEIMKEIEKGLTS